MLEALCSMPSAPMTPRNAPRLLATLGAETSYAPVPGSTASALSDEGLAVGGAAGRRRRPGACCMCPPGGRTASGSPRRSRSVWRTRPRTWSSRRNRPTPRTGSGPRSTASPRFSPVRATAPCIDHAPRDAAHDLAEEVGLPLLRWEDTTQHVWWSLVQGRLGDADRLTFDGFALGYRVRPARRGLVFAAGSSWSGSIRAAWARSSTWSSGPCTTTPASPACGRPSRSCSARWVATKHARSLLTEECGHPLRGAPYDQFWLVTLVQWALVAGHLRAAEPARMLRELLAPGGAPRSRSTGAHVFGAVAARAAGLTAGATDHFAATPNATSPPRWLTYRDLDAPVWAARAQLAWADVLIVRAGDGDSARASELIDSTPMAAAQRFGAGGVELRATALRARMS